MISSFNLPLRSDVLASLPDELPVLNQEGAAISGSLIDSLNRYIFCTNKLVLPLKLNDTDPFPFT